ncbi:TPA: helix-turn-helix domain-containing protein [Legionella pneumophila]|uniref:helix-turn-helix domain-containing protein n=1 Tax=Legionella anisa TaxID=28082 RepID=UPI00037784AA|nr:helix-turn-helix domain-containing protein [Legionella anisa]
MIALFKSGLSQSEIAKKLGIGRTSVRRMLTESQKSKFIMLYLQKTSISTLKLVTPCSQIQ